jgi:hypothetical protein
VNAKPLVLPGLSATSATSYWLGGAKEMAAINPILIIVNDRVQIPYQRLQMTEPAAVSRRFSVKKAANLRRNPRFVNHLVVGWREFFGPNRPAPGPGYRHAASFGTD